MGLDMYLEGRIRSYRPFQGEPDQTRRTLEQAAAAVGLPASDNIDFIEISREVGYWRKANQIHQWFVENVQHGEDECRPHYAGREKLAELRDICHRILEAGTEPTTYRALVMENGKFEEQDVPGLRLTKAGQALATELLPTQGGFFFGSTDYDCGYVDDLERTIAILDRCLALPEQVEFEYRSSW